MASDEHDRRLINYQDYIDHQLGQYLRLSISPFNLGTYELQARVPEQCPWWAIAFRNKSVRPASRQIHQEVLDGDALGTQFSCDSLWVHGVLEREVFRDLYTRPVLVERLYLEGVNAQTAEDVYTRMLFPEPYYISSVTEQLTVDGPSLLLVTQLNPFSTPAATVGYDTIPYQSVSHLLSVPILLHNLGEGVKAPVSAWKRS